MEKSLFATLSISNPDFSKMNKVALAKSDKNYPGFSKKDSGRCKKN